MSNSPTSALWRSATSMFLRQATAGPSRHAQQSRNVSSAAYPFSSKTISTPTLTPPSPSLLAPRNGTSVVNHINESLRATYDPSNLSQTLFSRRHRNRLLPGSVVSVTSYTSSARTATSTFSGVLMGIRRRGVDTSFRLRNVISKTGIEVDFKLMSPLIREVKVVRMADGKSGLKNLGRAKVNYLRDRPGAMSQIASALKTAAR